MNSAMIITIDYYNFRTKESHSVLLVSIQCFTQTNVTL